MLAIDTWSSVCGMNFNGNHGQRCLVYNNAGHLNNDYNFQPNSGNFHDMSFVETCTRPQLWLVQWWTLRRDSFHGTCGSLQQQMVEQSAGVCIVLSGDGFCVTEKHVCNDRDCLLRGNMVGTCNQTFPSMFLFIADGVYTFEHVAIVGTGVVNSVHRLTAGLCKWMYMFIQFVAACAGLQLTMVACTVTLVTCLALHWWIGMSHLSCGRQKQQRLQKRRLRRDSIRVQKQLVAIVLLCSMTSARAMEGEQMQGAVLQRMASMAEAATLAAMAAEEALKRSSALTSSGSTIEGLSMVKTWCYFSSGSISSQVGFVLEIVDIQKHWTCWRRKIPHLHGQLTMRTTDRWHRNSMQCGSADIISQGQLRPHGSSRIQTQRQIQALVQSHP